MPEHPPVHAASRRTARLRTCPACILSPATLRHRFLFSHRRRPRSSTGWGTDICISLRDMSSDYVRVGRGDLLSGKLKGVGWIDQLKTMNFLMLIPSNPKILIITLYLQKNIRRLNFQHGKYSRHQMYFRKPELMSKNRMLLRFSARELQLHVQIFKERLFYSRFLTARQVFCTDYRNNKCYVFVSK